MNRLFTAHKDGAHGQCQLDCDAFRKGVIAVYLVARRQSRAFENTLVARANHAMMRGLALTALSPRRFRRQLASTWGGWWAPSVKGWVN